MTHETPHFEGNLTPKNNRQMPQSYNNPVLTKDNRKKCKKKIIYKLFFAV